MQTPESLYNYAAFSICDSLGSFLTNNFFTLRNMKSIAQILDSVEVWILVVRFSWSVEIGILYFASDIYCRISKVKEFLWYYFDMSLLYKM